jgi:alkanesulfonate monooxygenase SsuD/methylene tetrahydromethanopterin reductase-like flavin-dependent oxidoreductase (luciferase family)
MQVWHFSEMAYHPGWEELGDSLRNVVPSRVYDPVVGADLYHRDLDEWALCDELGINIMVNEHHTTATCTTAVCTIPMAILARETKRARLLVLGYPIGHRPDPLRVAEELATIDVISRGRLDMGFVKGVPYEFAVSNQNPVGVMDRFWEAHDFILKAMTSHDEPFNWESESFHYRHVNVWPRPYQQPHPPVWSTTGTRSNARVLGEPLERRDHLDPRTGKRRHERLTQRAGGEDWNQYHSQNRRDCQHASDGGIELSHEIERDNPTVDNDRQHRRIE